ncbi:MAG: carbohydrate ABC transporter permease, partial [Firmicutes bacterium]|nr:carbohydrate ABC transporter permease [Bacillota bacterium]
MNVEYGKPNTAGKVINVIIYIFLILLAAVYLLPLLWVVMTSVKDDKILMISPWAFPEHLMWENYTFA